MRTPMIASLVMLALASAGPAEAQRLGRGRMVAPQIGVPQINGPQYDGAQYSGAQFGGQAGGGYQVGQPRPPVTAPPVNRPAPRQNWGGRINGRWIGGMQAPGGWGAYRRPGRGFRLPGYWTAPGFFIGNFAAYGLATPPYGYSWSRYYDDAVLIDGRGRVYDSVTGIDWDDFDDEGGYVAGGGYGASYAAPADERYVRHDDRYRQRRYVAPPQPIVQPLYPQGYSQTWTAGSGYYYPGGVTTTITVQQAPVVTTTTTTEYVEEVEYRAPARRVHRKPARKWRPAPKPHCSCSCGC